MKMKPQWWPLGSYWSENLKAGDLMLVDKIVRRESFSSGLAVRVLGTKKLRYKRPRYMDIGWFVPRKLTG